ncbi:hypothetical protein LV716_16585 [Flagellimonas sp. HMM57]|nr:MULTISPECIES: hypothetical protein [unclassified Flagellimonas]UII75860.1 hypothetical protein LV716_16585 [Flagellimonas sp. HMM57]
MQFLNKEIEALVKRKKSKSLVKKQISCGIFQDLENETNPPEIHKTNN